MSITTNNEKVLHLSLKLQWWKLIKAGIKLEEYREITPFWFKRLFRTLNSDRVYDKPSKDDVEFYTNPDNLPALRVCLAYNGIIKRYNIVEFSLGYPKKDDKERRMRFEIEDITVGTGNHLWGAQPTKTYFVIKLGKRINL